MFFYGLRLKLPAFGRNVSREQMPPQPKTRYPLRPDCCLFAAHTSRGYSFELLPSPMTTLNTAFAGLSAGGETAQQRQMKGYPVSRDEILEER
jgi:hypothetical protein